MPHLDARMPVLKQRLDLMILKGTYRSNAKKLLSFANMGVVRNYISTMSLCIKIPVRTFPLLVPNVKRCNYRAIK